MALLPKIGGGHLVGPEQIMLMHKPKQIKRRQTFSDNSQNVPREDLVIKRKKDRSRDWWKEPINSQNTNSDSVVLNNNGYTTKDRLNDSDTYQNGDSADPETERKGEISRDWWKDRSEVAMSVNRKTKRRRKMADEKATADDANRMQRALGPHYRSTKQKVGANPCTPVRTGRGITTGHIEKDRRVRFEESSISSEETNKKPNVRGNLRYSNIPHKNDNELIRIANGHTQLEFDEPARPECDEVDVPIDLATPPAPPRTVHARVKAARERARLWAETCSDPGDSSNHTYSVKAIHNDAVLKGRPLEPRRGRTFNEPAKPKFEPPDRQENRHNAPERGKRIPPSKKETDAPGPDQRTVSSAPAKEQPVMNGPVPKVNTLIPRNDVLEKQEPVQHNHVQPKPAQPKPVQDKPTQTRPKQEEPTRPSVEERVKPSPRFDKTTEQKSKPAEEVPTSRPTTEMAKPKVDKPIRKQDDPDEHTEEEKTERKHPKLPPDDHGPINPPKPKLVSPPPPQQQTQDEEDENFKYYASKKTSVPPAHETPAKKVPVARVPPLNIHPEKSERSLATQKVAKSRSVDNRSRSRSRSPAKSQRSKTVDLSKSPRTDISDQARKRREVTIIDSKNLPKGEREPFMEEFEYGDHEGPKAFDEMDDEEKIDYFKTTLKLKPEQIRELTFHPKVNEPKAIHNAYTGTDAVNWRSQDIVRGKSAKRQKFVATKVYKKVQTVEPYKRKSFMLSRLQGTIYKHINNVYGNSPRNNREKHFFQKLAQVQMDEYQKRYNKLEANERKWLESTYRQKQQLRHVRKKFEDDAWRRFMTQYVTSKVLESEYKDREEFGLPNDLNEPPPRSPSKRIPMTLTPNHRSKVNQKRFGKMFEYNVGPQYNRKEKLKFEGIDSVYVDTEDEHGKPAKRRQTVAEIMREAKKILNQSDDSDVEDSPSPVNVQRKSKTTRHLEHRQGSEKYERPKAHRARDWRHSEGAITPSQRTKSRSKSRSRPPPKTMKDVIDRRHKEPTMVNRYKASNFESIKKNLLKDSAYLDKTVKGKIEKPNKTRKDPIDEVAASNDTSVKQVRSAQESDKDVAPKSPNSETKPVFLTTVTTTTTETTNEKVIQNGTDGTVSKASYGATKGDTDYLDHTETQMGIETAREHHEVKPKGKQTSPKRKDSQQSQAPEPPPPKQPAAKDTDSSVDAEVASLTSQRKQTKQNHVQQENRRQSQVSRTQSLASSDIRKQAGLSNGTRISRASSRISIIGKQPRDIDREATQGHRASSTVNRTPSRATDQSTYGMYENKLNVRKNSVVSQQSVAQKAIPNGRVSRTSVVKALNDDNPMLNGTGRVSRTSNKISTHDSIASASNKTESNSHRYINGDIKETINTKSPERQRSIKNGTPVLNGYSKSPRHSLNKETPNSNSPASQKSGKNATPMLNGNSHNRNTNEPIVKRNVHVDDVVNDVVLKTSTSRAVRPAAAKTSKTKQDARPRASKPRVIRARSPAGRAYGHEDTQISMDELDRKSQRRPARANKRSGSKGRGRATSKTRKRSSSRSRDRNRSVSRDRRRSQPNKKSYSRFPDIDKTGRHSRLSDGESKTRRNRNVTEDVTETERVITPAQKESKPWKDLVQKYLRQPSPKVGKTEDRALLEAPLDTDEDDDNDDIFARAKKRYLLDSDDDSV